MFTLAGAAFVPSYPTATAQQYRDSPVGSSAPVSTDSVTYLCDRTEEALKVVTGLRTLAVSLGNRLVGPVPSEPTPSQASTGLSVSPPLVFRTTGTLNELFVELDRLNAALSRLDAAL